MKRLVTLGVPLLVVFSFVTQPSIAETNTVFSFLRNDVSPRAAGLAGSFVTVTGDPNSIFYNPAALSTLETPMGGTRRKTGPAVGFHRHSRILRRGVFRRRR